ncbi:hypothetical protein [Delftia acidovorans]|uniref:hypothetical protein n=1 Tax=Delftia acidovorans TaxID=80866 RepID=UPI002FDDF302
MTPYDKQYIEERLASVKEDINSLLALCSGRQKFSPGDKEQVRYDYTNLKSKLSGLAIHVFESDHGRNFCHSAGLGVAAALSAKAGDAPPELTRSLESAQLEVSYWVHTLSK